jgi:hypothetical protein
LAIKSYLRLAAFVVCADASGSDIKISPEQAVRFAESWLEGRSGGAFGVEIIIENWYLGAKYRPDVIMNEHGGAWDAAAIKRIAERASAGK